jgi:hypothetical protein
VGIEMDKTVMSETINCNFKVACRDSKNEVGCCHLTNENAGGFFVTGTIEGKLFHFMAQYCPFCGAKYHCESNSCSFKTS